MKFIKKYGNWAVITGAARGIGKSFAKEIASRGLNLILIDILQDELTKTVHEILSCSAVEIKMITADLSDPEQVKTVIKTCEPYSVGLFCCNHAMTSLFSDGTLRSWIDSPLDDLQKMVSINLTASINLIYYFANRMVPNKRGGIIIMSSAGALSGSPYVAQYAATKAFLANLGEGLWWELKHHGVDVITVLPGLVKTENVLKGLKNYNTCKLSMLEPKQIAKSALDALGKKMKVCPGFRNKIEQFLLSKIFSRKLNLEFFAWNLSDCFFTIPIQNNINE